MNLKNKKNEKNKKKMKIIFILFVTLILCVTMIYSHMEIFCDSSSACSNLYMNNTGCYCGDGTACCTQSDGACLGAGVCSWINFGRCLSFPNMCGKRKRSLGKVRANINHSSGCVDGTCEANTLGCCLTHFK